MLPLIVAALCAVVLGGLALVVVIVRDVAAIQRDQDGPEAR